MKLACCWFAVLAFAASSTDSAHAGWIQDAHNSVVNIMSKPPAAGAKINSAPVPAATTGQNPNSSRSANKAPVAGSARAATQIDNGHSGTPPVAVAVTNPSSISGTGLARSGASAPVVGGPTKPAPGVISGTGLSMKHP